MYFIVPRGFKDKLSKKTRDEIEKVILEYRVNIMQHNQRISDYYPTSFSQYIRKDERYLDENFIEFDFQENKELIFNFLKNFKDNKKLLEDQKELQRLRELEKSIKNIKSSIDQIT